MSNPYGPTLQQLGAPSSAPGSSIGAAGWYSGILSKTAGPIYRAFTGVVDPWTKNLIAMQQAADDLRAQGITDPTSEQYAAATNTALADVNSTISTAPGPCTGVQANDPMGGLICSFQKLGIYVMIALAVLIGVYLYGKKLEGGGQ